MDFLQELKELSLMQQTYAALFSVSNKLQKKGDEYFDVLSSRQFMTILAIMHLSKEDTTINNISRKIGTTKQNVKTILVNIEKKGLIKVFPSEKDKRAINVEVTVTGMEVMNDCGEKGIHFMGDIFNKFTSNEIEVLGTLLKKLYAFDSEIEEGFESNTGENEKKLTKSQIHALQSFSKRRLKGEC